MLEMVRGSLMEFPHHPLSNLQSIIEMNSISEIVKTKKSGH